MDRKYTSFSFKKLPDDRIEFYVFPFSTSSLGDYFDFLVSSKDENDFKLNKECKIDSTRNIAYLEGSKLFFLGVVDKGELTTKKDLLERFSSKQPKFCCEVSHQII